MLDDGPARIVGFVLAFVVVIVLHGVLGELVPKRISLAAAEKSLLVLAVPMRVFVRVMRPVIAVVNRAAGAVLRLLKVPQREELMMAGTASELARLIDASHQRGPHRGAPAPAAVGRHRVPQPARFRRDGAAR